MSDISVSISNDNVVLKEISGSPGGTMSDLMAALGTIKSQTNEYLTELVEASKTQAKAGSGVDDPKETSGSSNDNSTRPSVVVVPEKKAKV